jgi:mRNA interferase MazF
VRSTPPMTASVSRYRPWDVVVVPFPYSDQAQATVRPGIVVSAPRLHQQTRQYFVAMVTNAKHSAWDGDVAVSNLKGAGLPVPSVVRPAKLAHFGPEPFSVCYARSVKGSESIMPGIV